MSRVAIPTVLFLLALAVLASMMLPKPGMPGSPAPHIEFPEIAAPAAAEAAAALTTSEEIAAAYSTFELELANSAVVELDEAAILALVLSGMLVCAYQEGMGVPIDQGSGPYPSNAHHVSTNHH